MLRSLTYYPCADESEHLVSILVVVFLHNFAFNAGTFYLALFFQVCGTCRLRGGLLRSLMELGS